MIAGRKPKFARTETKQVRRQWMPIRHGEFDTVFIKQGCESAYSLHVAGHI